MEYLDVCYASSDEYAIHTGISLLSLFENNPGLIRLVYLLDYGIKEPNRRRLTDICESHGAVCRFTPALETLERLGKKNGLVSFRNSYATYSRAFLDQLLPAEADRILYIDSDTVILDSVAPLLSFDMEGKVIAGAVSCSRYPRLKKNARNQKTDLGLISGNSLYIQCGILLYRLAHWREAGCFSMIEDACGKLGTLRFADQTLINNAIPERYFGILPIRYNLSLHNYCDDYLIREYRRGGWYPEEEIRQALAHPAVVHFNGGRLHRPWFEACYSRKKEVYYHYKSMSAWRDVPLEQIDRSVMTIRQKCLFWLAVKAMKAKSDKAVRAYIKVSSFLL